MSVSGPGCPPGSPRASAGQEARPSDEQERSSMARLRDKAFGQTQPLQCHQRGLPGLPPQRGPQHRGPSSSPNSSLTVMTTKAPGRSVNPHPSFLLGTREREGGPPVAECQGRRAVSGRYSTTLQVPKTLRLQRTSEICLENKRPRMGGFS